MNKNYILYALIAVLITLNGFAYTSLVSAEITRPGLYDDAIMRTVRRIEYENEALRRRNLIAMPMCSTPHNGPFGSFHYNPDSPTAPPVDVYVNPSTSCAFQNVLEQWNERFCPDSLATPYEERDCRVSFGNISHRNTVDFPPHRTHKDGTCIDIRPMRNGEFRNEGLRWARHRRGRRTPYDRDMTAEFLRLAKENGASMMLFNDPAINSQTRNSSYVEGVRNSPGHEDHMHVCFDPNQLTEQQSTCPTTPACGENPSRSLNANL